MPGNCPDTNQQPQQFQNCGVGPTMQMPLNQQPRAFPTRNTGDSDEETSSEEESSSDEDDDEVTSEEEEDSD